MHTEHNRRTEEAEQSEERPDDETIAAEEAEQDLDPMELLKRAQLQQLKQQQQ